MNITKLWDGCTVTASASGEVGAWTTFLEYPAVRLRPALCAAHITGAAMGLILGLTLFREKRHWVTQHLVSERVAVVHVLAETHVELVLVHPFREGNGRLARILSTLMALQAGLPLLDFGLIAGERKEMYFAAVQAGLDKNYKAMEQLFAEIIERSLAVS